MGNEHGQSAGSFGQIMRREIEEGAALVGEWAMRGGYETDAIAAIVSKFDPCSITLVGRGTSDNAANYAKYLLEIMGGFIVGSLSPSTFTMYHRRPRSGRCLCIAVSQSGQSPDIVASTTAVRAAGGLTLAVTNNVSSPLAASCDHVLDIGAGAEIAIAATKSFTCEVMALLDLAVAVCKVDQPDRKSVSLAVDQCIRIEAQIQVVAAELAKSMSEAGHLIIISRGASTPIAQEGALKIMETSCQPAHGYSAADFEHGPIAVVRSGTPIVVVSSPGAAQKPLHALALRLQDRGAHVVTVGNGEGVPGAMGHLPVMISDPITAPIPQAILLQLLALHLANSLGMDPDHPPGLRKVTRTR